MQDRLVLRDMLEPSGHELKPSDQKNHGGSEAVGEWSAKSEETTLHWSFSTQDAHWMIPAF